jgi:hypothetical protein
MYAPRQICEDADRGVAQLIEFRDRCKKVLSGGTLNPYSGGTRLGFGKHRGLTRQELLDAQPGYCKWILSNVGRDSTEYMITAAAWLEDVMIRERST